MHGLRCKLTFLFLPFLLMACSTTTPGIKVEYVDKPVLVEKPCLKPEDVPSKPGRLSSSGMPANVEAALSVALAKVSEWTRYGNKADVLLTGCAK